MKSPAVGEVHLDEAVELLAHTLQSDQYHRMNALMEMYGDHNFTVLGFPCNQFGLQSPEENEEILNVLKYVRPGGGFVPKFPIFSKVEVNGLNEEPLFTFLKESLPFVNPVVGDIKRLYWSPIKVNDLRWNFERFLVTANGMPYKRYDLHCPIEIVERDIAELI
ncbi:Glutathione peroxidase 6 [Oryzias melastigma]|uniref:Glutathione peroxidase n=1 Tax=Oryzias melastigma TaxID=30732 RepID=A0A834C027_ORYME|nr:Glutathione peroxidase 6 [Oryzias melastigma]